MISYVNQFNVNLSDEQTEKGEIDQQITLLTINEQCRYKRTLNSKVDIFFIF